jgi:hypothetical protein
MGDVAPAGHDTWGSSTFSPYTFAHARNLPLALPWLVLAALLGADRSPVAVATATGLLLALIVTALPWRLPRRDRKVSSVAFERVLHVTPGIGVLVVAAAAGDDWIAVGGLPWLVLAVVVGGGLIALSGMDLRALVRGDLAFLAPAEAPGHSLARAAGLVFVVPAEETLFRGEAVIGDSATALTVVLAAVSFVALHHVGRVRRAAGWAAFRYQVAAAVSLTALALLSGAILAPIVAHLIANAPAVVLSVQQALGARGDEQ